MHSCGSSLKFIHWAMRSAADLARSEAEAEMEKERSVRMASLLGFSVVRLCVACA